MESFVNQKDYFFCKVRSSLTIWWVHGQFLSLKESKRILLLAETPWFTLPGFGSYCYSCPELLSTQLKWVLKTALLEPQRSLRTYHKYFLMSHQKLWRESRRPRLTLWVVSRASSAPICQGPYCPWACLIPELVCSSIFRTGVTVNSEQDNFKLPFNTQGKNVDFIPVSNEFVPHSSAQTNTYTRVQGCGKIAVLQIQWNSGNPMLSWLSWAGCDTLGKSLISVSWNVRE